MIKIGQLDTGQQKGHVASEATRFWVRQGKGGLVYFIVITSTLK